ncbi:MAG: hypothetical protein NWR72_14435 [Bacteroidia bacterium]|nr:hypothetical protein [Bacteroidia bacterium]
MKPASLLFLLLSIFSFSCKNWESKYGEGPILSPFTAEDRVTNTWNWAYYAVDGINVSGQYADSTLLLTDDNIVKICGPEEGCREGSWRLISKKTRLQLIFGTSAIAYDIDLLKKNEMWLSYLAADSVSTISWQLVAAE